MCKELINKSCQICSKQFQTTYSKKKFCSDECKKIADKRWHDERRLRLFENGICVSCGKELEQERKGIYHRCSDCEKISYKKEKNKYEGFKPNNVCDRDCENCKYSDCILEIMDSDANEFKERKRFNARNLRYKNHDKFVSNDHKRYEYRKTNGLCVKCGKPYLDHRYSMCSICRYKNATQKRIKARNNGVKPKQTEISNRLERKENGYCYFCGKPAVKGKKTCVEHLGKYQEHWEKYLKPSIKSKLEK